MSSNFQAELKESEVEIMCHMKKNFIQLKKNYCLGKKGFDAWVSQVGMSFFGGLRSEWMKSGHGGGGGQKRPKMGGRHVLCTRSLRISTLKTSLCLLTSFPEI